MNSHAEQFTGLDAAVRASLIQAYYGEVVGRALFNTLAAQTNDPVERAAYLTLERVEDRVAAAFDPRLVAALQVDEIKGYAKGVEIAKSCAGLPWNAVCSSIIDETRIALTDFYFLRDNAPESFGKLVEVLIEHEELLVEAFAAGVQGASAAPRLDKLTAFLDGLNASHCAAT